MPRAASASGAMMLTRLLLAPLLALAAVTGELTGGVQVLFDAGQRDDRNRTWACVRGAALVRTPKSNALLAISGGHTSCADGAVGYGILSRVSHDNGSSWSGVRYVGGDDHATGGYVAPMVDRVRKTIIILYNHRFAEVLRIRSFDDGLTWGQPTNLTAVVGQIAVGPPGGVQLPSGRLVQAVHGAIGTYALWSDDGGDSWSSGQPVPFAPGVSSGGESQLVDDLRSPSSLTMLVRVGSSAPTLNHALALSDDAGATWSTCTPVMATGPTCEGSIARTRGGELLLSMPHGWRWRYPADRRNMTVFKLSYNHSARTYQVVGARQIWHGPAAYSALSLEGDAVMFEGGEAYRYASVMFASTNASSSQPWGPAGLPSHSPPM